MPLDSLVPGVIGIVLWGVPTAFLLRLLGIALLARRWPTTTGTITRSSLVQGEFQRNYFRAVIEYRYHVEGQDYTGQTVFPGDFIHAGERRARETVRSYPTGRPVRVHYDPRRPKVAVLEPRVSKLLLILIALGLFMTGSIAVGLITGS